MARRHLEKLRVLLKEATGLDISYAFDDLVFPEHSAFLLQFDDEDESHFFCYFHKDCNAADGARIEQELTRVWDAHDCTITFKGRFDLNQKGESVEIGFLK